MRWSRSSIALVTALALTGALAAVFHAPTATSQATTLNAVRVADDPGTDPDNAVWQKVPGVDVPLTAQTVTYPNGGGTTASVQLRAVHANDKLYVRASWKDTTQDATQVDVTSFTDAAALEFPAKSAVSVPSFCMGQANSGVNIWQWRAEFQSGDPVEAFQRVYPNAHSDGLPGAAAELEQNPIYQPARALNNPAAMSGESPVENLIAQAFGTLSPAGDQTVSGKGVWRNGEWTVVFVRPFGASAADQAQFSPGTSTNMAVAVWDGANGDRNGQKSVSQFVTLQLGAQTLHSGTANDWGSLVIAVILGGGAVLAGLALLGWIAMSGSGRRRV